MIRFAHAQDYPEIRRLWERCFPDSSGFNPYFFEHVFQPGQALLLEQDHTLCAMLQMLPYQLHTVAGTEQATYIYGACTAPEARKRGYMAQLLERSFVLDQEAGRAASILIPQEEWLFGFYQKYGYERTFYVKDQDVAACGIAMPPAVKSRPLTCDDIPALDELYRRATGNAGCAVLRTPMQWQRQIEMFQALGLGAYALHIGHEMKAYAFVWETETGAWAQELLAADAESEINLCGILCRELDKPNMRITKVGMQTALGCAKFYDNRPVTQGYINLMFN
ncbi:GNAT family N-acetyltransferase [Intestinibacillus massiliensis]|nr:GNAT family N-acetyltransferase [Intestinibacillus massiliensis]